MGARSGGGFILPSNDVMVVRRIECPHGIPEKLRVFVVLVKPAKCVNIEDTPAAKKFFYLISHGSKVNSHFSCDPLSFR